jgi:outer membrane receptor protein involved in Fe transport
VKLLQDNSKFAYEFYVNNLFDKEFLIDAGNTGGGLGIPTFVRGMPRIAGVRVYYEF